MLINLLRSRRSIRAFADLPVEDEKLDVLIEAALRSPTARGGAPWKFVFVTDRETIAQLATAKPHGATFLKDAPLVAVVCANPEESDVWIEDATIATLVLHLTAHDLGLGSCWVQVRLRKHDAESGSGEFITGLLGLDPTLAVEAMLAIGYPAESKPAHAASSLAFGSVIVRKDGHQP